MSEDRYAEHLEPLARCNAVDMQHHCRAGVRTVESPDQLREHHRSGQRGIRGFRAEPDVTGIATDQQPPHLVAAGLPPDRSLVPTINSERDAGVGLTRRRAVFGEELNVSVARV